MHTGWWYIALSGTKDSPHGDWFLEQVSATFIPSFAIAYVLFRVGNRAIFGHGFLIDNVLFYLIPVWLGIHWNYLTFFIPDIDLTPSTLRDNSVIAVVITVSVGLAIAAILVLPQIYYIWKSGLLKKYLLFYFSLVIGVVFVGLAVRNHLEFHLHHYMVAILLFPITRFNTRSSAFLQALLFGLFINGGARWGFASMFVQKSYPAAPGPNTYLSITSYEPPVLNLAWNASCPNTYSVFMNDYEVYRGVETSTNITLPVADLLYHFCVRCATGGGLGKCSEYLSILATFPIKYL